MIDPKVFETLADVRGPHLVSIYLQTSPVGREEEDRIAFKNLLQEARGQLTERFGLRDEQAHDFLAEAERLSADNGFWQEQTQGLAVFIGADDFFSYHTPFGMASRVDVTDRFYLSPLLPSLDDHHEFYLLTLSRGATKLFLLDRNDIRAIDTTGIVPENMEKALLLDDPNAQLQRSGGAATGRTGVYFGHGAGKDTENGHLKEYMDIIDGGVRTLLKNDRRPLLLAGVEELIPIYRQANDYHHLIEDKYVRGNVDEKPAAELHRMAWEAIGDLFDQQRDRDYELYSINSSLGETSDDLAALVPAAINGRVAVLWVNAESRTYGHYDPQTNGITVTDAKTDTELHNRAAVAARRNGARVYVVPPNDLPTGDSSICGILRYSVDAKTTNLA